jgi:hypothetical protein
MRARPREFRIERLAQWGRVADPFLDEFQVERLFEDYNGRRLTLCRNPILAHRYFIAIDPAAKHDAFVWIIGHREGDDANGHPHVVFDAIRRYLPADYEGGELDLDEVLDHLADDYRYFRAVRMVTDQYGGDFVRQDLNRRLVGRSIGANTPVEVVARTRDRNLAEALRFREALQLGHVHSYEHPQLRRELLFLQETVKGVEAPTSGPVTNDDCAVAAITLTNLLLDEAGSDRIHDALRRTQLRGVGPFGPHSAADQAVFDRLSNSVKRPPWMRGERRRRW